MPGEPRTVRRKLVKRRADKAKPEAPAPPEIPRIARLMACAIVFDELLARGEVRSYKDLAAIAQVSPARISHVMGSREVRTKGRGIRLPLQLLDALLATGYPSCPVSSFQ